MNYLFISDCLWYSGHILSGIASIFSNNNFKISISLIIVGQFITIISRPIGRIKSVKNNVCIENINLENGSISNLENGSISNLENGSISNLENGSISNLENRSISNLENRSISNLENIIICDLKNKKNSNSKIGVICDLENNKI